MTIALSGLLMGWPMVLSRQHLRAEDLKVEIVKPDAAPAKQPGIPTGKESGEKEPDYIKYEAYNTGDVEIDLTRLEIDRFVRSQPAVSPDRQSMAYTEVLFTSNTNQVFSRLYVVPVQPLILQTLETPLAPLTPPPDASSQKISSGNALASHFHSKQRRLQGVKSRIKSAFPSLDTYTARYDPNKTLADRILIHVVGQDRTHDLEFKTLTVVDWSASGQRLLVKQKNGILHYGLQTSDVLVYDQAMGTVVVYPEIKRIIAYYWNDKKIVPPLDSADWDLIPLGWQPGSDSQILIKAWAYTPHEKKFLGLWQYNIDAKRMELLTLQNQTIQVASNGWRVQPDLEKYRQDRMQSQKAVGKIKAGASRLLRKSSL